MEQLTQLLERAETCHRELALEYFNAFAGIKDQLEAAKIMSSYPELYSRETLDYVRRLENGAAGSDKRRTLLADIFTGNFISDKLKEDSEKLVNAEGEAEVEVDGEKYPYRSMPVLLANEANTDRRRRMNDAYIEVLASLNPLRADISRRVLELVRQLGYSSIIEYCEQLKGMRIYPLREQLGRFLDETEELYLERLDRYSTELIGMGRDELDSADIGYLLRASRFDEFFPADRMVGALRKTLAGMGIDLDGQDNVTLDLEVRPKKSPRAFCIGIDVPRDVRLVLSPRGGQDDFSTLFHEAGHLEFSAHMAPDTEFIHRQHGDTSVHESYAFLLQHLVDDPVWWQEIMGVDPGGYPEFARFKRLYMLRRYSAKLHYEVEFHEAGGGEELAQSYAKWLSRGCGVPYPKQRYLSDFDSGFYVLEYLQAWIWEVQLRGHLKREFGEAWFSNPAAGDFLRNLWRPGMEFDVWEIAQQLGYDGLDVSLLQRELMA
jgi:hypothetical protein